MSQEPHGTRDPHKTALYQFLWHLESQCGKQTVASWMRAYQLQRPKAPPPAPAGPDGEPHAQPCAVCTLPSAGEYQRQPSHSRSSPNRSVSPTHVSGKVLGVAGRTQRVGGGATTPVSYGRVNSQAAAPSASKTPKGTASQGMKQLLLGGKNRDVHGGVSSGAHGGGGGGDVDMSCARSEVTRHSSVSRAAGAGKGGHSSWEAAFITQVNAAGRTLGSLSIHQRLRNETLVGLHNCLQQSVPETSRRVMSSMGDPFIQASTKLFQMMGFQLQANELAIARSVLPLADTLVGLLGSFLPPAALEGFVPRLLGSLHHPNLLPLEPELLSTLGKLAMEAHQRRLIMLRFLVNHLVSVLMAHPMAAASSGRQPPSSKAASTTTSHNGHVFFLSTEALQKMMTHFRTQILSILTRALDRDSVKVRYLFDDMISPVEYVVPWHSTSKGTMKALNSLRAALVERHHCKPDEVILVSREGDDIALQDATTGRTSPPPQRPEAEHPYTEEEEEMQAGAAEGITAAPHLVVAAFTSNGTLYSIPSAGASRNTSPSPRLGSQARGVDMHSVTAPVPNLSAAAAGAALGGADADISHMTSLYSSPDRKKLMRPDLRLPDANSAQSSAVSSPNTRTAGGGSQPTQREQVLDLLWDCLFENNKLGSDGVDGEFGHVTFSVLYVAFPAEASHFFKTRLSVAQQQRLFDSLSPLKSNQTLLKAQVFNYAISTRCMLSLYQDSLPSGSGFNRCLLIEDQSASWNNAKPALRRNPLRQGGGGRRGSHSERASVVFHDPSLTTPSGHKSEVRYAPSMSVISGGGRSFGQGSTSMRSNNGSQGVKVFSGHSPFATPTATAKTTFHRSYTTNTYLTVPGHADPLANGLGQGGGLGTSMRSHGASHRNSLSASGISFDIPRTTAPPAPNQPLSRQLSEKRVPSKRPNESVSPKKDGGVSPVAYPSTM